MMRRHFARLLALTLAVGVAAAIPTLLHAQTPTADGTWTVTMDTPQGTVDATMTLATKDGQLAGTLMSPQGEVPLTGSLAGNALKLMMNVESPQGAFSIEFTGDVEGNTIANGKANLGDFGEMAWSAKRAE